MRQEIIIWEEEIKSGGLRKSVPLMSHAGVELTGKTITEAVQDGQIHFEALKAIDEKYSPDAVCSVMDLTVEAEAFGCRINFYDHDIPTVATEIVHDEAGIDKLEVPDHRDHRTREYIKAMELSASLFTEKPVFAVCIGPFSLAGRIFGMTEIMTTMLFEPEVILKLVDKCKDFLTSYISEFKRVGANGIIMAEPAAGLLSSEQCDNFSSDFIRSIVNNVQDNEFLFILHNCGNTGHVTQSMISTGARGLHFGNRIDLLKVLEEVPADILVMGNIDPVGILKMSDPKKVSYACQEMLNVTSEYKNYILSSGCEIPPGVSFENFNSFFESVRRYNTTK